MDVFQPDVEDGESVKHGESVSSAVRNDETTLVDAAAESAGLAGLAESAESAGIAELVEIAELAEDVYVKAQPELVTMYAEAN